MTKNLKCVRRHRVQGREIVIMFYTKRSFSERFDANSFGSAIAPREPGHIEKRRHEKALTYDVLTAESSTAVSEARGPTLICVHHVIIAYVAFQTNLIRFAITAAALVNCKNPSRNSSSL